MFYCILIFNVLLYRYQTRPPYEEKDSFDNLFFTNFFPFFTFLSPNHLIRKIIRLTT